MPEYLAPGVYIEEVSFRSKSIEGVGTSTTAFAGPAARGPLYFASDRAIPAGLPWAPLVGVPEVITSYTEFERIYGGFADYAWSPAAGARDTVAYTAHAVKGFFDNGGSRLYFARTFVAGAGTGVAASGAFAGAAFRARFPGSGGNGAVTVRERRSPASDATLASAPVGALVRLGGGNAAGAARIESAVLPGGTTTFAVHSGQTLTIQVGTPPVAGVVTFTGAAAEATAPGDLAFPLVLGADTALAVTADGYVHSVPVAAATYNTINDLLAVINAGLRHASASAVAGGAPGTSRLRLTGDRGGASGHLAVAQNDALGFTAAADVAGSGNVADLDAVTVAELNGLLAAAPVAATAALSGGRLVLVSTALGAAARLQVDGAAATSAHLAFSLPTTAAVGVDGSTPAYYVKDPTLGWRDAANAVLPSATGAELVTLTVLVADAAGTQLDTWDDVGLHPQHPRWLGSQLAQQPSSRDAEIGNLAWLDLGATPADALTLRGALLGTLDEQLWTLAGGDDGVPAPDASAATGAVAYQNAFDVLAQVPDISIVATPASAAQAEAAAVRNALITHADRLRYRFAVLDTPPGITPSQAREVRGAIDSTRAALYYPWVIVANPNARPGSGAPAEIAVPPSGFLCGVYARTDVERGVWKAPANEVVRSVLRFERDIPTPVNEVLNPEGINCLRAMLGRGLRVWGGRTISSDPEWKYLNVRRYFIYLERSIDVSTQWAVFEPNGEALWANVRETVSAFLYNEWRNGALLGSKPEEAYFVRCDRSTMTQNDLDNGRLVCLIGVAALKPAEFVIFRIGQTTADARS
jgi:hypothetical protein